MVHALKEIWRVLVPGGILLDLRPLPAKWPLEIVADRQVRMAGFMDESPSVPHHVASQEALAQVVSEGEFLRERQGSYDRIYDYDSLNEMKDRVDQSRDLMSLPPAVWIEAQRLAAGCGQDVKARIRIRTIIGRYPKCST